MEENPASMSKALPFDFRSRELPELPLHRD